MSGDETRPFIPYGRQSIDEEDIAAVINVLKSDFLTTGPLVQKFERALGEKVDATYTTVCSSGTAALHLALSSLKNVGRLKDGNAVIIPSMTFLATANCVELVGAKPVFADCDPNTGLMERRHVEDALTRAAELELTVSGVIPVHLNGQTAHLRSLYELTEDAGLFILEDAAHALGTRYADTCIGGDSLADLTCFSFHPVKTITMGEGGAVTTANEELHHQLQVLRNHGMTRKPEEFHDQSSVNFPWYYEMHVPGFNYRAPDILCALGLSQLKKLDQFVNKRLEIVNTYDRAFSSLKNARPISRTVNCEASWHLYPLLIDFEGISYSRAEVMNVLKNQGIGTQVHYIPVHSQPYYRRSCTTPDLPDTNSYYSQALSLPLYPSMTTEEVNRVIDTVSDTIK